MRRAEPQSSRTRLRLLFTSFKRGRRCVVRINRAIIRFYVTPSLESSPVLSG